MAEKGKRDGRTTLEEIFDFFKTPTLSSYEKALWMLYRAYDGGEGAWPGDDVLAAHMDKSVRSVQGYRARLLEAGFLHKKFRGPKPAIYRAVIPTKASQPLATLEAQSLAALCDARPKASQEASQVSVAPLYSLLNTGNTEKTPEEEISQKRFRYTSEQLRVIDEAVDAFRSTRTTNRIAASVVLAEFVWWESYTPECVVEGLRTYVEKSYATEGKAERYARGIVRSSRPADPEDPDYPPLRSFS